MFLDTLDCIGRLGGGVRVKKHLRRHPSEKDVSGEWLAKIRAHVCAEYNPSRPTGITFLFSVGIFLNCLNLSFFNLPTYDPLHSKEGRKAHQGDSSYEEVDEESFRVGCLRCAQFNALPDSTRYFQMLPIRYNEYQQA